MDNICKNNSIILFQGDSITDCERNRADLKDLGNGYVLLVSKILSAKYPQNTLKFLNRGISGDKIGDLQNIGRLMVYTHHMKGTL